MMFLMIFPIGSLHAAPKACVQAVTAAGAGRWQQAYKLATAPGCVGTPDVVAWIDYQKPRAGQTFAAVAKFLLSHPRWPHLKQMRRLAEDLLGCDTSHEIIMRFFAKFPPLTGRGALYYALALSRNDDAKLPQLIKQSWHQLVFNEADEKIFLQTFGCHLKSEDHTKRLNWLIWHGHEVSAKRIFTKVPPVWRDIARLRFALDNDKATPKAVLKMPPGIRQHSGLVYSVAAWYVRHEQELKAASLILEYRGSWDFPEIWWQVKAPVVRTLINQGRHKQAYLIANQHYIKPTNQEERGRFADAEWIAGWIALKRLHQPQRAAQHFERLYTTVEFPVSLARAAYWRACAYQAMRKNIAADTWFQKAASYQTTFYGQLAQHHLKHHHFSWQQPSTARPKQFGGDARLIPAAMLLAEAKLGTHGRSFLKRLIMDAASTQEQSFILTLTHQLSPALEGHVVSVAQKGGKAGEVRVPQAYPVVKLPKIPIEPALAYAIIRRETGFQTHMVGGVGELGLMQVRPETAKDLAKKIGWKFDARRLKGDTGYSIQIGSEYLARLINLFGGSYILAITAYNAGPGNVRKWLNKYGDPRAQQLTFLDWIESIPFADTRAYVQNVVAAVTIYRHRLGDQRKPLDKTGRVV